MTYTTLVKCQKAKEKTLKHVFWGDLLHPDITLVGAATLEIVLHTADPRTGAGGGWPMGSVPDSGAGKTYEADYTGYGRTAVTRGSGSWTFSSSGATCKMTNTAAITCAACTGGTNTITWVSVTLKSDAGSSPGLVNYITYCAQLEAALVVSNGMTPVFDAGDLIFEEQ